MLPYRMDQIQAEIKSSQESNNVMRDELQKSYLMCSKYEEQILRLNQQLTLESSERQKREESYENKIHELSQKLETMEEGMYDPEAYYCLERDRVSSRIEVNLSLFVKWSG